MSIITTRYLNRHRPAPVREAVVLRSKTTMCCSTLQRKIKGVHFEISHLSHIIVRRIGLIAMSNGRAITQIPIDRCPLYRAAVTSRGFVPRCLSDICPVRAAVSSASRGSGQVSDNP